MNTDALRANHWKKLAVKFNHERERIYKEMQNLTLDQMAELLNINGCSHIMDYCDLMARRNVLGGLNAR